MMGLFALTGPTFVDVLLPKLVSVWLYTKCSINCKYNILNKLNNIELLRITVNHFLYILSLWMQNFLCFASSGQSRFSAVQMTGSASKYMYKNE